MANENPYSQLVQDDTVNALKSSMQVVAETQPDVEAKLQGLAKQYGLPVEAVRLDHPAVERRAKMDSLDYQTLAEQYPGTSKFLSDPTRAAISHDDVQNLSATESTIGPIRGPKPSFRSVASGLLNSLPQGAEMARQGIRLQMADLFGFDAVRKDAQERYSRASLESANSTPEFESDTARGVYGGLSSTVRMIPGLAASIATRSTAPMLATMGLQTQAEGYGKYTARGATPGMAFLASMGEGTVEIVTELPAMGFLVKNLGRTGAGAFLTGLLARELPSEQIATLVQDAIDTAVANPDKTWGEYGSERGDAAYQTLIATITQASVMGGVSAAVGKVQGRSQEAGHANGVGEALQQMNTLAAASKLRERDTTTAQTFFQSLLDEGRESVWITPQALADSGMAEQIAQSIPGVTEQLQGAQDTGVEIRISIAELMANMAGPELAQSVIPHLADEPGGFTATTAAEYMQSGAAQEMQAEVERVMAEKQDDDTFKASRDIVRDAVKLQLDAASRFKPDVNATYSTMVSNFYAVTAAKMNITPEALFERYPLAVNAEGVGTLNQGALAIDTPEFQNWFGESKVVDAGGKPQVVYHGTGKEFDIFEPDEKGLIFTTPEKQFAEYFAKDGSEFGGAETVMSIYVSAHNPFDYSNDKHVSLVLRAIGDKSDLAGPVDAKRLSSGRYGELERDFVTKVSGFIFRSKHSVSL